MEARKPPAAESTRSGPRRGVPRPVRNRRSLRQVARVGRTPLRNRRLLQSCLVGRHSHRLPRLEHLSPPPTYLTFGATPAVSIALPPSTPPALVAPRAAAVTTRPNHHRWGRRRAPRSRFLCRRGARGERRLRPWPMWPGFRPPYVQSGSPSHRPIRHLLRPGRIRHRRDRRGRAQNLTTTPARSPVDIGPHRAVESRVLRHRAVRQHQSAPCTRRVSRARPAGLLSYCRNRLLPAQPPANQTRSGRRRWGDRTRSRQRRPRCA